MFSLSERIDDVIDFGGEQHAIDMSFDNIINVQRLILDEAEDSYFKVMMSVALLIDVDFEILLDEYEFDYIYDTFEILLEYIGFKSKETEGSNDSGGKPEKVFDYQQDAEAIYASFFMPIESI